MGASSSTSSSSTITHGGKYDLFISFRGEDIRDSFISHLRDALSRKKIGFFVDEKLQRGDEIWPELSSAIEESRISVVIFSKDYASSKWCLRELIKILECKETKKQTVLPVFYHVNPSDVRKQTASFQDAFADHDNVSEEEKQIWRAALAQASNLCGWDSSVIRPESRLVDEIVRHVLNILDGILLSSDFGGLVGINSRIEKVNSLLDFQMLDFRVVGIWGMGGIGKTTIVRAIFEQFSGQFEGSFFANIREESEKCGGLVRLRIEIIRKILEDDKILNFGTPNIPTSIKRRLQKKKIFIVLDDVDNYKQLEILFRGLDQFGLGSRVIMTTRDKQVLCNCRIENIYEVEPLQYWESCQLLFKYAFNQDFPSLDLQLLVDRVVYYAAGNPLALKVLALCLHGKSKQEWESALEGLQRSFNPEIYDVLKISYDGLNDEQKDIFLDIACFFKGKDKDYVTKILDDCYYSLSVLIGKSLIAASRDRIQVHDLLQEMGREIIRRESPNKLGSRSRLWKQEDALRALKENDVTDAVRGIFLDMDKMKDIYLSSQVFEKMKNLRFLKFYSSINCFQDNAYVFKVHIFNGLNYISNELRSFQWYGCPLKVLPSSFDPEKLVELVLPYSNVEQLWERHKQAPKLKWLILHNSRQLTTIPDLSDIPLIQTINLENCKSLLNIHTSVRCLDNLRSLNLRGCENLRSFPSNIHFEALELLDLSGCINLTKFPQISGNTRELILCGTGVEEVPSSIQNLNKLFRLDMSDCRRLKCISTSISTLKSLNHLYLRGCSELESFPEILEIMECWKSLDLSETGIKELPSSLCNLSSLTELYLGGCLKLDKLPENLGCLKSLEWLCLSGSAISQLPSSITCLENLQALDCVECRGLTTLPPLSGLKSLMWLGLRGSAISQLPSSITCLENLRVLDCVECRGLTTLPPLSGLCSLRELILNDCILTEIPEDTGSLSLLNTLRVHPKA